MIFEKSWLRLAAFGALVAVSGDARASGGPRLGGGGSCPGDTFESVKLELISLEVDGVPREPDPACGEKPEYELEVESSREVRLTQTCANMKEALYVRR